MFQNMKKNGFLFSELVKRDFKQKYKRTALGMAWSVLSPLLTLLVMKIVFTEFFGRNTPHYTTYLFAGNIVMSYFKEATKGGMGSLMNNSRLLSKVNIPKYLFLLSWNVSAMINFLLTLLYPILCLTALNIGVGMILSAMYVFFRDTQYLYDVFLTLLTYLSAIFYQVDRFSPRIQQCFLLNPVYCMIKYFRVITIDGNIPSLSFHLLCAFYAAVILAVGCTTYKKYNNQFVYYF